MVLEPGSVYDFTATVIPDPRTQKVTLFASQVTKDQSGEYDIHKIKELHARLAGKTVAERVEWFTENFQRYSKVRRREDVILASHLTSFAPLYIEFDGKRERGWIIFAAIGDSTTGKSEVNKHMIRLIGGGQYIVAETASMVGLAATATQTSNGWFVEWGPLVLGDRRLIVIDGAQKLSRYDWSTLAEAQRLGLVKLTKAAKGEAYARTRQIIIANPLSLETFGTTKEMSAFLHPYMALATVMDTVTIARLDLAVFVTAGDVTAEDINQTIDDKPDPCLANLKDLRAFAWNGKYKVEYSGDFIQSVHTKATELYNKYNVRNVPLASIDLKYKLVRLGTALALATCSLNEKLDTVTVTVEHVEYIASFLDQIYSAAGLHEGAQHERDGDIDEDQIRVIINAVTEKAGIDPEKVVDILKWMGQQASFSLDQLRTQFELADKKELRPLTSILQTEGLITRVKGFYRKRASER